MLRALAMAACLWSALAPSCARAQAAAERALLERTESAVDARGSAREQNAVDARGSAREQNLAHGQRERALRGLTRALARSPSPALLQRYAELALPLQVPAGERERTQLVQAAQRLLDWLRSDARAQLDAAPRLVMYTAWALSLRGEFETARALLASEGARDPALNLQCLRAIAAWAVLQGALQEAEQTLILARGFAPTDLELASELGLLLLARGAAQEALAPLAERFAADPRALSARRDFAYALRAAGRAREGYELLRAAQPACAAAEHCLLELARAALEAGQPLAALAPAEQQLLQRPGSLDALFLIAEANSAAGRPAAARAAYASVLQLAPSNLRAKSALEALGPAAP